MSLNYAPQTVTAEEYDRLFHAERQNVYPVLDALEHRLGVALDRERLEAAARVLACPKKAAEPNWQHGRMLFAVARDYAEHQTPASAPELLFLDIGTAKGFSALCLAWALDGSIGRVVSVDVMPPDARVRRNTVAEVGGLRTLAEILAPWPEARQIHFEQSTGRDWLTAHTERVHVAFIDGKHTYDAVSWESVVLAARQQPGDIIVFDDVQIPGIAQAVRELRGYDVETIAVLPIRKYAIARKR